jgi:hypothetical protein
MTDPDTCWIGVDESGKGDYFGPLVIAAVCVETETAGMLRGSGVKDSKTLSDRVTRSRARHPGLCRTMWWRGPPSTTSCMASSRTSNKLRAGATHERSRTC